MKETSQNICYYIPHKISYKLHSFEWQVVVQPHCAHEWGRFACLLGGNSCGYMRGQYVAANRTGKSTRIARSNLVGISAKFGPEAHTARTSARASSPFHLSRGLSTSYFSPVRFRIACLKHESDIIARRAILPRSYGTVRKGTPRSMTARRTRWTLMIAPAC